MDDALSQGLVLLCQNDPDIKKIVSPSCKIILPLLEQYLAEIERFNPSLSLVGTNDRHCLIVRHILDSLAPLGIIFRAMNGSHASIADVGSGAGLPGIPLAITLPDVKFTLIERKNRRAGFLRNVCNILGLSNVSVE
ncbi:MAG: class I SAM-dependent methyltransferase, partial [Treponema sp.]|nr:class I SAM-dependent methyltransferase [Treponema sp.]